jgi:NDP-sugar pyrophosphorylase family protein
MLNIVIPMAGRGSRFQQAGYAFPKPLIEIKGKTMIEVVVNNLRPKSDHRYIFICQKEHYDKFDLYNVLKNASRNKFEIIQIDGVTEGAACTVLTAQKHIDNDSNLLIANSDQFVEVDIDDFVKTAQKKDRHGLIMTFPSSHPKWSYARTDKKGTVIEVAEKKVISNKATVGIYFFNKGSDFVKSAQSMIEKNIRFNNEFYVCPTYNELILDDRNIGTYNIKVEKMHGLGTPEDLIAFIEKLRKGKVRA